MSVIQVFKHGSRQAGLTLWEVVLSLFLVSLGLMGVTHLEILSLNNSYYAFQLSMASAQLSSMVQRIKANPLRLSSEISHWNEQNYALLPEGKGEVNCSESHCKIKISWVYHEKHEIFLHYRFPPRE